ncbi:twin-arginine translocase TatA/TatE family subunit [Candidatus Woesebacteria bacterium]|nr:twin-arginine translocase TatA/TatE family subunit [Candidatus Woesebacteria bacterium]
MLKNIGTTEILIIAALILIFFGGKKLPELAKGISQAIREFKDASKDDSKKDAKKDK